MTELLEVLEQSHDLGFLGSGPVADHVLQAEAFQAAALPQPPDRFLDLGTGGGVPGLVLALAWPEARATLLDAQLRRVRFLASAVAQLGCADRVAVVHGRAEDRAHDPDHRGRYDIVTSRSFGPPAVTAECGAGFLVAGGVLVVAEPPRIEPGRWVHDGLAILGLLDEGTVAGTSSSVRRLRSIEGPQVGVPRRAAAIARRPLF